jgi:2-keto-4-pentenoate hydratase/2-oxohepta-3-ene-1,7-dioic acid hydratase in catechol pathway
MRLIRFGDLGSEKPGVLLDDDRRKDCSAFFKDWDREFFQNDGLNRLALVVDTKVDELPDVPQDARWGSPVARPGKIIAIGLNFADHAKEGGLEVPDEPILFMKATNSVVGPYDEVLIPRRSQKTDWEVELGLVIGQDARYLDSPDQSAEYIAGYCISHDVSEREFQAERCGQWVKGKSCDTFSPLGPFVATRDEVPDVNNLDMALDVNGERRQTGNTKTMIFDVFFLVHYVSQFMTLEPGDIITTGTPPGVGLGMDPPQYLKEGDTVELTVSGLGHQKQVMGQA